MASATLKEPAMLAPERGGMLIVAAVLGFTGVVDIQHNVMQTGVHFLGFQLNRAAFCAISSPDVATPPALAALPGTNSTPASREDRSLQSWFGIFASRHGTRHWQSVRAQRQRPVRSASRMANDIHRRYARGC